MRTLATFVTTLLITTAAMASEASLPSWFPNPGVFDTHGSAVEEAYGSARFRLPNSKPDDFDWATFLGHHWSFRIFPAGDPKTWSNWNPVAAWAALKPGLERAGFRQILRNGPEKNFNVTLKKDAGPAYIDLSFREDPHDSYADIVEVGPNPFAIKLTPPAATKPETFGVNDDIPYLWPLAGAKTRAVGRIESGPLVVDVEGESGYRLVGTSTMQRSYSGPAGLSQIAFENAYEKALTDAGWTIVKKNADQGRLFAHYAKNGRDIWTYVRARSADEWYIDVADTGTSLRSDLAKDCKASLYGVNFDFNKATLRPDSEPPLNQLLSLLRDQPKLTVEIGGHTDDVGKADYNMTLSGQRAETVKAWLVAHGIAASRLTSHGYGDTAPLVPNNSDDNRAKNRRVEVKNLHCAK